MFLLALHFGLGGLSIWGGLSLGGPGGALLAWLGLTGIAVGLGYAGLGARIFDKDERGAHGWLPSILLLPYRALVWLLWQGQSRLRPGAPHHEIAPGLYVGRRPLHRGERPERLACVVDLTSEFGRSPWFGDVAEYVTLPTLDMSVPDDASFRELVERVAAMDGPVYVHCAMGHGRAPTVVAAVLLARGLAADAAEASATLERLRPNVHIHGAQRALLERFAASQL